MVVADAYPKARHHYLVIARDTRLSTLYDLEPEHAPLVSQLLAVGRALARELLAGRQGPPPRSA